MRTLVGQGLAALLLLGAGEAFRRASLVEGRMTTAEADLATLSPEAADAEYGLAESDLALAGRIPLIGDPLVADLRQGRAMVAYWRGDYAGVPTGEADLAPRVVSPDLVFLAGNASYRKVLGQHTGQAGAQDLDPVLRLYTMLLKKSPGHLDGAYNYEYVVRLRNVLAKTKNNPNDAKGGGANRDQPLPPSVHGARGSPPTDTPPDQFNVIVPLRPEERGELMKARTGAVKQRKG